MNSSSLANCKKRVKQFKDLCANQSANVEKTSFLKEFFYNWDKKEIILKENASKQLKVIGFLVNFVNGQQNQQKVCDILKF